MRNAIVIGASSGIGRALAKILASNGFAVGLVARRTDLLFELRHELPNPALVKAIDVSDPVDAMPRLRELIAEMHDVELFVVSAGTGFINPDLAWEPERDTIAVNVVGFSVVVNVAAEHLRARGAGHIVAISSLAALRGHGRAPAYNASKAFVSNYLEGLRHKFTQQHLPIIVTDVQAGFVQTAMAKGDGLFWVAAPEQAARQIFDAIRKHKRRVYVTKRWRLIAWMLKALPDRLYDKL